MRRTFIVGCPRSGTTIVQALLARHPAIYTLPETGFFGLLHDDTAWRWGDALAQPLPRRWKQRLGFTREHVREAYAALHRQLADRAPSTLRLFRMDALAHDFLTLLDRSAADAGRSMWVEKTPNHLLYINEIEAMIPDARFVHVVRRGADVLASLLDASLRFENEAAFGGGAVHWVRRWNRALQIHGEHVGRAHHHFVFHEDLAHEPEAEWLRLCAFLDLSADASLADACQQNIADLRDEPWKLAAIQGQVRQAERKVEGLFGYRLQRWLQTNLASYDELRTRCLASCAELPSAPSVAQPWRAVRVG